MPKARDTLIATRTKLINSVRGTLKSFGYRLPACSGEAFVRKAGPHIPAELSETLRPLLLVVQHVSDEIRRYDKRIEQFCERYPATLRLRSIRGVGPITALACVLHLNNDPRLLRASRDAGPRLGLRPKRRDSGARPPELSITNWPCCCTCCGTATPTSIRFTEPICDRPPKKRQRSRCFRERRNETRAGS